jgi:hypothetical protein
VDDELGALAAVTVAAREGPDAGSPSEPQATRSTAAASANRDVSSFRTYVVRLLEGCRPDAGDFLDFGG